MEEIHKLEGSDTASLLRPRKRKAVKNKLCNSTLKPSLRFAVPTINFAQKILQTFGGKKKRKAGPHTGHFQSRPMLGGGMSQKRPSQLITAHWTRVIRHHAVALSSHFRPCVRDCTGHIKTVGRSLKGGGHSCFGGEVKSRPVTLTTDTRY